MPEANGEISNEFFRKLNQQIVQKDNLIKLLQLQIRNLKSQIENGEADAEKNDDLQKMLDQKNSELEGLRGELEEQKKLCDSIKNEKDEQIRSMKEMLEQNQGMTVAEYTEDPKVSELEEKLRKIQSDYAASKQELEAIKLKSTEVEESNNQLKTEIDLYKGECEKANQRAVELDAQLADKEAELATRVKELKDRTEELRVKTEELESVPGQLSTMSDEAVKKAVEEATNQSNAMLSQVSLEAEAYKNQVTDLNRQVADLQNELAGRERNEISSNEELQRANEALANAKNEIARLVAENEKIEELTQQVTAMSGKEEEYTELAMKLTAAENDIEKLTEDLEKARSEVISQTKKEEYQLQVSQLQQCVVDKEDEIQVLRKALEAKLEEGGPVNTGDHSEIEALTQQVADQLVTIEAFEKQLKDTRHLLNEREIELNSIKNKVTELETVDQDAPVNVDDNNDIIAGFIDFFDGLDNALSKKSDPELQALHKKLMERLIIPNQISYMPVISEEFDPSRHVATDYFRSPNFPEKCIVFEVEKGYRRSDKIIKKSKVWVVQNLFKCTSCGAEQTNSESRFCHLCGAKILAPNGLPIDSLPVFEPTATTFNRFSERMLEKGKLTQAKEYIAAGLQIDPNYVPLVLSMADVLITESKFQEAVDYLNHAYELKPDERTKVKIDQIKTKLNIVSQAKNLELSHEDIDKLLHIIQK